MEKEGIVMEERLDTLNSKVLRRWTNGSLVIIGLFAVLFCGFAVLVLRSGDDPQNKIFASILVGIPLISFLIIFLIVFFRFSCFVELNYMKLFRSLDIKYKWPVHKMHKHKIKEILEAGSTLVKVIKHDSGKNIEVSYHIIIEILEVCFKLVKVIKPNLGKNLEALLRKAKEMLAPVSKINSGENGSSQENEKSNDSGGNNES